MLPGETSGAQETALQPVEWALKMRVSQLSSLNSRTETLPSVEAQARIAPRV